MSEVTFSWIAFALFSVGAISVAIYAIVQANRRFRNIQDEEKKKRDAAPSSPAVAKKKP